MNMTTVPSNQLKAMQQEIESLKEQMAHIKEIEFPTKCIAIANIWKNKVTLLDETIAQQAEAIRLKDEALFETIKYVDQTYADLIGNLSGEWLAARYADALSPILSNAITIQPSPEILQARDKRVAEACAKVCIEQSEGIARSTPVSRDRVHTMFKGIARPATVIDCSESSVRESAFRIRNGAWERHL